MSSEQSLSLFNIASQYDFVLKRIIGIENPEELNDSLWDALYKVEDQFENKIENYAYIIKMLKNEADYLENEIKRLKERKDLREKKIDWLKDNLKQVLLGLNIPKVETTTISVRLQNNPPAIKVDDEAQIPSQFKELVMTTSVKKKEILKHIKDSGEVVPGVRLTQGKSLRIV